MTHSSASPRMKASADNAFVAGAFEASAFSHEPPSLDPDPGDTVRLPTFERSAQLRPAAG